MAFRERLFLSGLALFLIAAAVCAVLPGGRYIFGGLIIVIAASAIIDYVQRTSPVRRNYPVLGRLHDLIHFLQAFFGLEQPRAPYRPPTIELIRERAAGREAVSAFGARLGPPGVEILHAIQPAVGAAIPRRISIGGRACRQPYSASYLNISALAFGAISEPAIEALSRGARLSGCYYNTGEAGLPGPFFDGGGDLVWQLGTGYFGCRNRDGSFDPEAFRDRATTDAVKAIEIKLSQGSKPGKGGLLLADKITPKVAAVCQIPPGQDSVLPARHAAFASPIGLLEFVAELRELAGGKPVGFKLCVGQPVDVFAIIKAMLHLDICPDFISVDGAEGGTGAAPVEFQSFVGMPLQRALPFVHDALVGAGLRDQVRVIASGKIATGADMVAALARGADLCAAARAFMIAMGCIQALICESNRCPAGIATQNPRLTRGIVTARQAEHVACFHDRTLDAFCALVAATGCTTPEALTPSHLGGEGDLFYLETSQLIDGDAPDCYRTAWEQARAECFYEPNPPLRVKPRHSGCEVQARSVGGAPFAERRSVGERAPEPKMEPKIEPAMEPKMEPAMEPKMEPTTLQEAASRKQGDAV